MKPRKCDVAELAIWLHDTAMKLPKDEDERPNLLFSQLRENQKRRYKFVAEQLLTNPPAFLKVTI